MATHSSTLAWKIPWTEEAGRLEFMGSQSQTGLSDFFSVLHTGVGSLSLLQGIFPTQGSNPGLPQCRRILNQLSHHGNPILEWVADPFFSGSSPPRNQTRVSCIAGRFFAS